MYNKPKITSKGYQAITHYLDTNEKIPIKRMLLSAADYTGYDLESFELQNFNINLACDVVVSKEKVKVVESGEEKERMALKNYGIFTNENVEVAFDVKAVALTCIDSAGEEIILAMLTATAPYEKIQSKEASSTFSFIMNLVFDGSDNIQVITTGAGLVNEEYVKNLTGIEETRPTLDAFPLASENQRKKIRAIDTNILYKSTEKKDGTWEWIAEGMGGGTTNAFTTLTLPITAESYTLESDGTYSIEFAVEGMTEDFISPQSCKYARPNPYSPSLDDIYYAEFKKIKTGIPLTNKIKVILNEIPTTSIDFYLFGIGG